MTYIEDSTREALAAWDHAASELGSNDAEHDAGANLASELRYLIRKVEAAPDPRGVISAAKKVVATWASGDLAGAVFALSDALSGYNDAATTVKET